MIATNISKTKPNIETILCHPARKQIGPIIQFLGHARCSSHLENLLAWSPYLAYISWKLHINSWNCLPALLQWQQASKHRMKQTQTSRC